MNTISQGWHVVCEECGRDKWPYLPERPEHYVCVLCRAEPKETRQARRAAWQKGRVTRQKRQEHGRRAQEGAGG